LAGNGSGKYLTGLMSNVNQYHANIAYSNSITLSWTVISATSSTNDSLGPIDSVSYFKEYWFAQNVSGNYYIQANGNYNQSWSKCNINNTHRINPFVVGGGYIMTYIMTYNASGIYFSSDGKSWSSNKKISNFISLRFNSLCYAGSYFFFAGSYTSNPYLLYSKTLSNSTWGKYPLSSIPTYSSSNLQVAAGFYNSMYYILINAPSVGLYMYSGSNLSDLGQIGSYSITLSKTSPYSIEWTGSYFIAYKYENVIVCCPTSSTRFTKIKAPLSILATYNKYLMGNSFATTTLTNACTTNSEFTTQTNPSIAT
jgi:hypothetical protein